MQDVAKRKEKKGLKVSQSLQGIEREELEPPLPKKSILKPSRKLAQIIKAECHKWINQDLLKKAHVKKRVTINIDLSINKNTINLINEDYNRLNSGLRKNPLMINIDNMDKKHMLRHFLEQQEVIDRGVLSGV